MSGRGLRTLLSLGVLLACVGCDQVTKQIAIAELSESPARRFLGGFFTLAYAENPGAFLGLGGDLPGALQFWIFRVAVGLLLGGMVVWLLATRHRARLEAIAAALMIGGGLSNWYDRLVNDGRVVDFMLVAVGPLRTGVFNVADVAIMGGMGMLCFAALRRSQPPAEDSSTA